MAAKDAWHELIDWCGQQGDQTCVPEIVAILEEHPALSGSSVALLLWDVATGQNARETGETNQCEETVTQLYRRFPSLAVLRPLLTCPLCSGVPLNLFQLIRELAEKHGQTAAEVGAIIRNTWRSVYGPAVQKKEGE